MKPDHPEPNDAAQPLKFDSGADGATVFQTIVADADEGVLVVRSDGMVLYANQSAEFLLGHGREELTGEMFGLPRTTTDQTVRVNVISRDGCVRLAEMRVEPLPAGPIGSLLLRFRDITAYHQDVVAAREQVRRRDEFLAMLSHEIRNPLAAIRSASHLLCRDDLQSGARRRAGEILDRQFTHLQHILDDLLDVSRISQGKMAILKQRVELNQIVHDALEEAAPLLSHREHRLQLNLPRHKVWVEGDATRLEQVVVNLVNNAAKFTPPKGNISVTVTAEGDCVEIRVGDDGPGIAEDLLPHIFEAFVQGRQSMARSEGGLGIGLALVHTIVVLHGGSVCAEPNHDGPGVTFTVKLPASAPGPEQAVDQGRGDTRSLRILLVEDADDTRCMLKQILQLEGHEVFEARDGPEGLAATLDWRPDVALVDIGLPGFDGYELARRVRQDERGKKVRMVALTGYGMPQDVQEARRAGFDGHFVKPVRYPDLLELLREGRSGCPSGDGH